MFSKKGEILIFIKENPNCRTKDIRVKFGNGGYIWTSCDQLVADGLVEKPSVGVWKAC